jgi:hypothetical protein
MYKCRYVEIFHLPIMSLLSFLRYFKTKSFLDSLKNKKQEKNGEEGWMQNRTKKYKEFV